MGSLAVHEEPPPLPAVPVDVTELDPTQLSCPNPRDIGNLGHHVVATRHHGFAGRRQRRPPTDEELSHRPLRRWHPQPEVAPVDRTVELIDRRLHRDPEPAQDLTGIALLEKREVVVDLVRFRPHRARCPLTRPGEIPVQMLGGQTPSDQIVVSEFHDRLHQMVQRARRQARSVPGPLILGDGVEEEVLLRLR